jgi:HPt (histidine-containing phosphotransfer) domain-containing protein
MAYHTFDPDDLLAEFGDVAVVCELVDIVRADLQTYLGEIGEAAASQNAERVRELAHAIKGAVANVSAETAQRVAATIEARLRTGDRTALADVPSLVLECQRLRAELGLWMEALGCGQLIPH